MTKSRRSPTRGGENNLISPQVSLIEGDNELVYSKEIPHGSKIKFEKDETTGKLYFILDGVYYSMKEMLYGSVPTGITYISVDLGLPSGLEWADRNVGAATPQDYGTYFSWGNVEGATIVGQKQMSEDDVVEEAIKALLTMEGMEVTPENIDSFKSDEELMNIVINSTIPNISIIVTNYSFDETTYALTSGGQLTLTGLTSASTLDAEHDAATVNMGEGWRMPTIDEINELIDNTDQYGIKDNGDEVPRSAMTYNDTYIGMKFVSKIEGNGNSILIPLAGNCIYNMVENEGFYGHVWLNSPWRSLFIDNEGARSGLEPAFNGKSVRGVRVS